VIPLALPFFSSLSLSGLLLIYRGKGQVKKSQPLQQKAAEIKEQNTTHLILFFLSLTQNPREKEKPAMI
jgi:hypothetical protein